MYVHKSWRTEAGAVKSWFVEFRKQDRYRQSLKLIVFFCCVFYSRVSGTARSSIGQWEDSQSSPLLQLPEADPYSVQGRLWLSWNSTQGARGQSLDLGSVFRFHCALSWFHCFFPDSRHSSLHADWQIRRTGKVQLVWPVRFPLGKRRALQCSHFSTTCHLLCALGCKKLWRPVAWPNSCRTTPLARGRSTTGGHRLLARQRHGQRSSWTPKLVLIWYLAWRGAWVVLLLGFSTSRLNSTWTGSSITLIPQPRHFVRRWCTRRLSNCTRPAEPFFSSSEG